MTSISSISTTVPQSQCLRGEKIKSCSPASLPFGFCVKNRPSIFKNGDSHGLKFASSVVHAKTEPEGLAETASKTFTNVVGELSNLVGKTKEEALSINDTVIHKVSDIKDGAVDKAIEIKVGTIAAKDKVVNKVSEITDEAFDKAIEIKDGAWNKAIELKDGAFAVTDNVVHKVIDVKDEAIKKASEVPGAAGNLGHDVLQSVKKVVSEGADKVKDAVDRKE